MTGERGRQVQAEVATALGNEAAVETTVVLGTDHLEQIREHARAAYPEECCGIIVGVRQGGLVVRSVHQAANLRTERAWDRYEVDPGEILRVDRAAGAHGEAVIGFYHSHPDHPAAPSPTDAEHAWSGYLYLIISVGAGGENEARAWAFDEERGRFQEWPLVVGETG